MKLAYDSDDVMAPLREKKTDANAKNISRSNTVVSYYTKKQNRLRSGTVDIDYLSNRELPTGISISDYKENDMMDPQRSSSINSEKSDLTNLNFSFGTSLHVANPDSD